MDLNSDGVEVSMKDPSKPDNMGFKFDVGPVSVVSESPSGQFRSGQVRLEWITSRSHSVAVRSPVSTLTCAVRCGAGWRSSRAGTRARHRRRPDSASAAASRHPSLLSAPSHWHRRIAFPPSHCAAHRARNVRRPVTVAGVSRASAERPTACYSRGRVPSERGAALADQRRTGTAVRSALRDAPAVSGWKPRTSLTLTAVHRPADRWQAAAGRVGGGGQHLNMSDVCYMCNIAQFSENDCVFLNKNTTVYLTSISQICRTKSKSEDDKNHC